MTPRQRLRRTAFTCIHVLANIACYRAGFKSRALLRNEHFWTRANSNFVDKAVLEWCKVFADRKATHYSLKVVSDSAKLTNELLAHLQMSQADFDAYGKVMRNLRDKFIAHLDDDVTAPLPELDPAIESVKFLLGYLFARENVNNYLEGVPRFPDPVYRLAYEDARFHYLAPLASAKAMALGQAED